ncbi:MAG: hypothetical protein V8Q82_00770 [Christensenellales bacterium]
MCCAVARHLGLSNLTQPQRGISQLQPGAPLLQLLRSAGGVTIIDDAFNGNPRGARPRWMCFPISPAGASS